MATCSFLCIGYFPSKCVDQVHGSVALTCKFAIVVAERGSAQNRKGAGARWTRETISVDAKDFDVAKLSLALGRHLDVGGLQVSVNDAFFVSRSNAQQPNANVPPLLSS